MRGLGGDVRADSPFREPSLCDGASLVAQTVKSLPAVQDTQVQSLGRKDPQKGSGAPSSLPSWRIPWTEEPGRLQSMGSQRVGHD